MKRFLFFIWLFIIFSFILGCFCGAIDNMLFHSNVVALAFEKWYYAFTLYFVGITYTELFQILFLIIFFTKIERKDTLVALTIPYGFLYIIYRKFLDLK